MNNQDRFSFGLGLILVGLFSAILAHSVFGIRFNHIFTDNITDLRKPAPVVVVGIDDRSLNKLGAWPFQRNIFADAVAELYDKGARLVVFDVLFLESGTRDDTLRTVIAQEPRPTIFASKLDQTGTYFPNIFSLDSNAVSAIANVYPDEDGKVRFMHYFDKDKTGNCLPTLSYRAFFEYTRKKILGCDTAAQIFVYPENRPKQLSFIDVYEKKIDPIDVKGKVVFIGSVSLD